MKVIGETQGLSSTQRASLERFKSRSIKSDSILDQFMADRLTKTVHIIDRSLALLVTRAGKIEFLIVGSKKRVYLPDLGRQRFSVHSLRHLRLIYVTRSEWMTLSNPEQISYDITNDKLDSEIPEIPSDIVTDILKLRLDCGLLLISSSKDKYSSILAHLNTRSFETYTLSATYFSHLPDISFQKLIFDLDSYMRRNAVKHDQRESSSAILIGRYDKSSKDIEYSVEEILELARTAELNIVDQYISKSKVSPLHRQLLKKGTLETITLRALELGVDTLLFDQELSPNQLHYITNATDLKVIDRSMLILDIFAKRASTHEGKLQVELAQLKYSLPRLFEKSTGLSRLTGGIGGRGPGETKLEISRRRARDRISRLEKQVDKLKDQRALRRKRRHHRGVPVVAIVGYTNAGKSSLLNSLTKSEVETENKLFATLEPSSRRMRFPNDREVIFIDTVGFIRNLPNELMAAFKATLEEIGDADLILHVFESSSYDFEKHIEIVKDTIESLGFSNIESILVGTKIDLLSHIERQSLANKCEACFVSSITREGLEELVKECVLRLRETFQGNDPGRFLEYSSGENS